MASTNSNTRFTPFSLALQNGAIVTGIAHIPSMTSTTHTHSKPLIVGIHGATCTAQNFDISEDYTASTVSAALGVPFVAFNRPGYAGSSPLAPFDEATSYLREDGNWEHNFILPALWNHFGVTNGCNGIVLLCHSMGVPGSMVAAALWSQENSPKYPLRGLILSGFGVETFWTDQPAILEGHGPSSSELSFPLAVKETLMLSEPSLWCAEPKVRSLVGPQTVPMKRDELIDMGFIWPQYWRSYAKSVRVPILYAVGEHDWLWKGTKELVHEFGSCFPICPRFEGSIVQGAPHALEWSSVSLGWYARCFGWAIEVSTYPLQ
ncbi:hypothetical protein PV08_08222 [Exophiala spinifera]|uniref:AB hydrolase-1 domain-containing protein n=1 Tax=Exophiala spinifera TaxID=91928 RepID=A0A0D2B371_9EURO|nr:uncharacterized protein PV08_08222 [Exophiala spinifera]KIW13035.1 hypothetical protein PV08_08222 [Exophiala spinifera]